jgi:hypothetical protein
MRPCKKGVAAWRGFTRLYAPHIQQALADNYYP